MWNRISGKKNESIDDPTSQQNRRRKDDNDIARRRSGSIKSSESKNKSSRDHDDRDRGFNPTSTAYSSTSRVAYPNTAGASVASSNATASANGNDESYTTPVLNRNQSLADKMPTSATSTRGGRDRDGDDERKSKSSTRSNTNEEDGRREKKSRREKTERKSSLKSGGSSRSVPDVEGETTRGPADFPSQVESSGFQQFPGQYDGGVFGGSSNGISRPVEHEAMSSHVQDQFPGQFPSESAEPYRPPLAASEGGPGLAAEYYGDTGQSVAEQPGFRLHSPSLIVGQEPHLQPASSVAAPPPEPSASGGVGAAASFFSGEFEVDEVTPRPSNQASSTYTSAPSRPNMPTNSSSLPALGGAAIGAGTAAMGAAAGYITGNQSSSTQQHDTVSTIGTASEYMTTSSQHPPSQTQGSYYSSTSQPPGSATSGPTATGQYSSHAGNIPIYAAAAAGAAGLAGSAIQHSHQSSGGHEYSHGQYATPTTPRHRHRGPLGALVDFVKDPEGVAQFEEYSEYVGICRHCFEPGSSPRDAPRRHRHFNRKGSEERIGRPSRVEKFRRDGSDDERRGKDSPSWLATGLAGYGLGKMGEGLFKQTKNFDDTYSVKSGRYSPEGSRKHQARRESDTESRRRRRSKDRVETGVVGDSKIYRKSSNGFDESTTSNRATRRKSRSRSRNRKSSLAGAALGAVAGPSIAGSSSRRRSHSGDRVTIKSKHRSRDASPPERRRRSHKKKKEKGFFSFGSNSSSSSVDLASSRSGKKSKGKSDDKKAEAALLGLGAAAAALAAADSRSGHKKNGVKELVGRKETREGLHQRPTADDAGWEDEEDYVSEVGSVDSGLAFGNDSDGSEGRKYDRRRRSEMSGKGSLPGRRPYWDNGVPAMAGAIGAGIASSGNMSLEHQEPGSDHDGPLQHVDPMPVSDFAHLDERMENTEPFQSRPPMVSRPSDDTPFHQPQPRAPVSSSVYATQAPFSQTHTATSGPSTYPTPASGSQSSMPRESNDASEGLDAHRDFKLRRRDTSPARFGPDYAQSDLTYRRKPSAKDDSSVVSGVRFALPEEKDVDQERREKRRRRKESEKHESQIRESRAREGERNKDDDRSSRRNSDQPNKLANSSIDSSSKSWAVPAAVGLAGAAVGAAAIVQSHKDSKEEETKEERRERRRQDRQRVEEEDDAGRERRQRDKEGAEEDTISKSERRRGEDHEETREERKARRRREREEREREDRAGDDEAATAPQASHVSFGDLPERSDKLSREESPSRTDAYKHEDYSTFFTPAIDEDDDQQVKISGANADADISFDQSPSFGIVQSGKSRNTSGAGGEDSFDPKMLRFPWKVPPLRLLYPTPPSSRGSTPFTEPRDAHETTVGAPSDASTDRTSSSKVAWEDEPVNVIVVEPRGIASRFEDPPSDDEDGDDDGGDPERLERRKPKNTPISVDQGDGPREATSYKDDNNFAAVLAASAEDAGFDPSIVIDNPTYRRRDSPPGSNGRHMPGGFEDEDDETRPLKGKKKDKFSRRESQPEERNDDAITRDIVSQVDSTDPHEAKGFPEANGDDFDMPKPKKSKKSKKGSKRSSTYDDAVEGQDPAQREERDESRPSYDEPEEESVAASTVSSKDSESRKKSRKSKGNTAGVEEGDAATAVAAAVDAGKDVKGQRKGSLWDRVLGKSATSLPESSDSRDIKKEEPLAEQVGNDSKKGKKSKRKATQSTDESNEKKENGANDAPLSVSEASHSTMPPAGSVAKYLAEDSDPEPSQEQVSQSFLGERPDPPPPPDIRDRPEEPMEVSREVSPVTPPKTHRRLPSEIRISDLPQSSGVVSSPTAVPVRFRRPAPLRARSSSQSPLPSTRNADGPPQPTKPRPRSTHFENSKEYRPLWLVERNTSRQDVHPDEPYPSLPSSHSTSRNSSPHSLREHEHREIVERRPIEPVEGGQSIPVGAGSKTMQSELLDSQQATPTASSFQHASETREEISPPNSGPVSPTHTTDANDKHDLSSFKDLTLAAVIGGAATYAVHKAGEHDESSHQKPLEGDSREPYGSLGDLALDAKRAGHSTMDNPKDLALEKKGKNSKKSNTHATESLADERFPSFQKVAREHENAESELPPETILGKIPTEGVVANDVINIMTSTAREPEPVGDLASKSELFQEEDAIDVAPKRVESKKSKKLKKKGQKSLIDLENPLDDKLNPQEQTRDGKPILSMKNVAFKDPFKEPPQEHEEDSQCSPTTTPLPEDDDIDLLDEPSNLDFDQPGKSLAAEISLPEREPDESEQANADDYFGFPTRKKSKKGRKSKQRYQDEDPFDDSKSKIGEEAAAPKEIVSPNPVIAGDAPGIEPKEEFDGSSSRKRGKISKGVRQEREDEEHFDFAPPEEDDGLVVANDSKTPEVSAPLENLKEAEDRSERFSAKKKSKDDRMTKSNVLFAQPQEPEVQNIESRISTGEPVKTSQEDSQADGQPQSRDKSPRDESVKPSLQADDMFESAFVKKNGEKLKRLDQDNLDSEVDEDPRAMSSMPQNLQDTSGGYKRDEWLPTSHKRSGTNSPTTDRALHEDPPVDGDSNTEWFRNHDASTPLTVQQQSVEAIGAVAAIIGTAATVHTVCHDQDFDAGRRIPDPPSMKLDEDDDLDLTTSNKDKESKQIDTSFAGPVGVKPPETLKPRETDHLEEQKMEEDLGAFTAKKSKKDKRNKKSRKEEDFTPDEPEILGPVESAVPVPEQETKESKELEADDLGDGQIKKSKKDKKSKKLKKGEQSAFDEPEARDFQAPTPLPELEEAGPRETRDEDLDDFAIKKSKKDKKRNKKGLSRTTSGVQTPQVLDEPTPREIQTPFGKNDVFDSRNVQDEQPSSLPSVLEPSEMVEPAIQAHQNDGSQEEELVDEAFAAQKSKNDKRSEAEATLRDKESTSANIDEGDVPAIGFDTTLTPDAKLINSADASGQVSSQEEARAIQPVTEDHFAAPKSKKDKKKSKKSKALALDDNVTPEPQGLLEGSSIGTPFAASEERPAQILKSSDNVPIAEKADNMKPAQEDDLAPPKSKQDKKKSKKSRDFSWGAYESRDVEDDSPTASQDVDVSHGRTGPPSEPISAAKAPDEESGPRLGDSRTVAINEDERQSSSESNHEPRSVDSRIVSPTENEQQRALNEDFEPRVTDVRTVSIIADDRQKQEREDDNRDLADLVDADDEPALKAKKSKKDKKKTRQRQASSWAVDEPAKVASTELVETPGFERIEPLPHVKADAIEMPGLERNDPSYNNPAATTEPIVLPVQAPCDVPAHLTFEDIIEPSAVIQPREQHVQGDVAQTASEGPTIGDLVAANSEEDFAPVKKGKKGKKSKKSKSLSFGPEDEEPVNRQNEHQSIQERDAEQDDILIVEGHQTQSTKQPEYESFENSPTKRGKRTGKSVQITTDEPEIIQRPRSESFVEMSREQPSQPDTPLSSGSVEMLDPEEQREYNEEYQKALEKELSPLREADGLLNREEQQEYNDEYQKELDRHLSPSRVLEGDIHPTDLAEDVDDRERPSYGMDEGAEQPDSLPQGPTLRHTALSDILEEKEPDPRSGSLQEPAADEEGLDRKKGKKGKKSKKSRQPVIWEDDTATPGLAVDVEPMPDQQDSSSQPLNLEEPIEQDRTRYHDLPSPTRGSPSASRSPKFDDGAEDYFAVKPRARAEENDNRDEAQHRQHSMSPEQLQDLPDWSSPPKEQPFSAHNEVAMQEPKRHRRERSPSRERRPRERSDTREPSPRQFSISPEGPSPSRDRTTGVGEIAATAAGAGILGAVELSRTESSQVQQDKNDKKTKISKTRLSSDDGKDSPGRDEASQFVPEAPEPPQTADRMPGQLNDTPPRSRDRSASLKDSGEDSGQREKAKNRDSAIQIADSPVVSGPEPVHRPQHDSGYPATEISPIVNDYDKDDHEGREIIEPFTDPSVKSHGFYQDHKTRPQSITSNPPHGIINSEHEEDKATDQRPISIISDPRNSIVGSDLDADRPTERRGSRRGRKRRESGATYDSDDSNDSGYDRQRRRRQALLAEEHREPSPVSSTTKDRSSVLFDSSPSDRHVLEDAQQASRNLPGDDHIGHERHRLNLPDFQDREPAKSESQDAETYLGVQEPRKSIFGGPINEEEALSRSRSPASNDARDRHRLKTISEDALETSPLARKGRRDVSDLGSPESDAKAQRTPHALSPLVTGAAAGAAVLGTGDLLRLLSKPSEDDDHHHRSNDMETSRSRDRDGPRRLSDQSSASAPNRDSDWRRQAIGTPDSIHAIIKTPDQIRSSSGQSFRSSGTPPLRRVDRSASGDLRGASLKNDAKRRAKPAPELDPEPAILGVTPEAVPSSSTYDPLTDKGKSRGDMADVYEGDGWRGQSPMSPTRPPSMRKRQSMQFSDLEQRFEQLAADHRSLQNAKSVADRRLEEQARDHSQQRQTYEEAMQEHKSYLAEKDSELGRLHEILEGFKRQVSELTEVNEVLQTSRGLDPDRVGDQSFQILAGQHDTTKRELEDLREQHTRLAKGHEEILEREIEAVRQEKDYELQQLQEELEHAKEQVRALQQQILASRSSDDYIEHDEDYFESKCTALCQHVQQWVLRFSKFSDGRACRLVGELGDDALSDLFDDAVLDGTEADDYLQDRVKRRDVFMSVVMSRIFDFIFRRYLFGLDREQRKKLKDLDATLTEVGPQSAVHKWRSTTLTLLSSRPEFADQREEDTEGVVDSIFHTLAAILPPKKDLIPQITDSLRRVVAMAVDLHIEMRLQRAEFQMLPPLKPQFDPSTGDLARKVPFNVTMMNERSGNTESNEQLQEEGAVVRMVLFPLVVKNSDDEEQIVVCPAQVLVATEEKRKGNGKQVRVMSAQGGRSEASFAGTEDTRLTGEGGMF